MKRFAIVAIGLTMAGLMNAASPATQPASQPSTQASQPLGPGNAVRTLEVDGRTRSYHVHVPPGYDANKPTPVVLAYHGAYTNGPIMAAFSGLNKKADSAGFVVVYPNGTGKGPILFFNAFYAPTGENRIDDVKFTSKLLDDLAAVVNVDPKRVFATGMSNGGMMCHRLAAELSDRIAAVAPVAGTLCIQKCKPARPISVVHIHGIDDKIVPYEGSNPKAFNLITFKSVDATITAWISANGCPEEPKITALPDTAKDGTTVTKTVYGPGKDGTEVVLYAVKGGGHTWPGQPNVMASLGKSTMNISANDIIWEFFCKHPMK